VDQTAWRTMSTNGLSGASYITTAPFVDTGGGPSKVDGKGAAAFGWQEFFWLLLDPRAALLWGVGRLLYGTRLGHGYIPYGR